MNNSSILERLIAAGVTFEGAHGVIPENADIFDIIRDVLVDSDVGIVNHTLSKTPKVVGSVVVGSAIDPTDKLHLLAGDVANLPSIDYFIEKEWTNKKGAPKSTSRVVGWADTQDENGLGFYIQYSWNEKQPIAAVSITLIKDEPEDKVGTDSYEPSKADLTEDGVFHWNTNYKQEGISSIISNHTSSSSNGTIHLTSIGLEHLLGFIISNKLMANAIVHQIQRNLGDVITPATALLSGIQYQRVSGGMDYYNLMAVLNSVNQCYMFNSAIPGMNICITITAIDGYTINLLWCDGMLYCTILETGFRPLGWGNHTELRKQVHAQVALAGSFMQQPHFTGANFPVENSEATINYAVATAAQQAMSHNPTGDDRDFTKRLINVLLKSL